MAEAFGKVESVRLSREASEWVGAWTQASAQDRATVLRAGTEILVLIADRLTFEARVRVLADMGTSGEPKSEQVAAWLIEALLAAAEELLKVHEGPWPDDSVATQERKKKVLDAAKRIRNDTQKILPGRAEHQE